MTRHGTLAYYLAAWVIGCFVVSLMGFAVDAVGGQAVRASMLLELYFFALIFGAADILLFALVLRRAMRWWGTHAVWIWLVAGAGLALVLVMLLGEANSLWPRWNSLLDGVMGFFIIALFSAPDTLRHAGLWQVPIEGAAIAAVLCLVDRAFNNLPAATPVPPATPETKQATV
jgi:hypothetical protein